MVNGDEAQPRTITSSTMTQEVFRPAPGGGLIGDRGTVVKRGAPVPGIPIDPRIQFAPGVPVAAPTPSAGPAPSQRVEGPTIDIGEPPVIERIPERIPDLAPIPQERLRAPTTSEVFFRQPELKIGQRFPIDQRTDVAPAQDRFATLSRELQVQGAGVDFPATRTTVESRFDKRAQILIGDFPGTRTIIQEPVRDRPLPVEGVRRPTVLGSQLPVGVPTVPFAEPAFVKIPDQVALSKDVPALQRQIEADLAEASKFPISQPSMQVLGGGIVQIPTREGAVSIPFPGTQPVPPPPIVIPIGTPLPPGPPIAPAIIPPIVPAPLPKSDLVSPILGTPLPPAGLTPEQRAEFTAEQIRGREPFTGNLLDPKKVSLAQITPGFSFFPKETRAELRTVVDAFTLRKQREKLADQLIVSSEKFFSDIETSEGPIPGAVLPFKQQEQKRFIAEAGRAVAQDIAAGGLAIERTFAERPVGTALLVAAPLVVGAVKGVGKRIGGKIVIPKALKSPAARKALAGAAIAGVGSVGILGSLGETVQRPVARGIGFVGALGGGLVASRAGVTAFRRAIGREPIVPGQRIQGIAETIRISEDRTVRIPGAGPGIPGKDIKITKAQDFSTGPNTFRRVADGKVFEEEIVEFQQTAAIRRRGKFDVSQGIAQVRTFEIVGGKRIPVGSPKIVLVEQELAPGTTKGGKPFTAIQQVLRGQGIDVKTDIIRLEETGFQLGTITGKVGVGVKTRRLEPQLFFGKETTSIEVEPRFVGSEPFKVPLGPVKDIRSQVQAREATTEELVAEFSKFVKNEPTDFLQIPSDVFSGAQVRGGRFVVKPAEGQQKVLNIIQQRVRSVFDDLKPVTPKIPPDRSKKLASDIVKARVDAAKKLKSDRVKTFKEVGQVIPPKVSQAPSEFARQIPLSQGEIIEEGIVASLQKPVQAQIAEQSPFFSAITGPALARAQAALVTKPSQKIFTTFVPSPIFQQRFETQVIGADLLVGEKVLEGVKPTVRVPEVAPAFQAPIERQIITPITETVTRVGQRVIGVPETILIPPPELVVPVIPPPELVVPVVPPITTFVTPPPPLFVLGGFIPPFGGRLTDRKPGPRGGVPSRRPQFISSVREVVFGITAGPAAIAFARRVGFVPRPLRRQRFDLRQERVTPFIEALEAKLTKRKKVKKKRKGKKKSKKKKFVSPTFSLFQPTTAERLRKIVRGAA